MPEHLTEDRLSRLADFVREYVGLSFPRERRGNLEEGIRSAAREFGFKDVESCLDWLFSTTLEKAQVEVLASHLTVGETYFFRDRNSFQILEERILPPLIQARAAGEKRLRIWSAGCATGEEPYTLAIVLCRLIPDLRDWNITILATDINPRFLEKAARGVYSKWSFRDVPPGIVERYFRSAGGDRQELLPEIRKMVNFAYLNLIRDSYPSLLNNTNAMDVIFCRNVIMYFSDAGMRQVIGNLRQSLLDGGWLVVSGSEGSHVLFSEFVTVNFPDAIFYRRDPLQLQRAGDLGAAGTVFQPPPAPIFRPVPQAPRPSPILPQAGPRPAASQPAAIEERTTAAPTTDPCRQAQALFEQGRYQGAVDAILGLVAGAPQGAQALVLLTRIYANQGRLAEALGWCEQAIAADKCDPGARFLHAVILQELGRAEEARKSLRQAIYLDKDFVMAYYALGNLFHQEGNAREAEKHFRAALHLLGKYPAEALPQDSEGLTAGRLTEIIQAVTRKETGDAG